MIIKNIIPHGGVGKTPYTIKISTTTDIIGPPMYWSDSWKILFGNVYSTIKYILVKNSGIIEITGNVPVLENIENNIVLVTVIYSGVNLSCNENSSNSDDALCQLTFTYHNNKPSFNINTVEVEKINEKMLLAVQKENFTQKYSIEQLLNINTNEFIYSFKNRVRLELFRAPKNEGKENIELAFLKAAISFSDVTDNFGRTIVFYFVAHPKCPNIVIDILFNRAKYNPKSKDIYGLTCEYWAKEL